MFSLASALLVAIGAISYQSTIQLVESSAQIEQTLQTIEGLESLLSEMKDAETGQRGYVLTGTESYLEPYNTATQNVKKQVSKLQQALGSEPRQKQQLDQIETLISQKLDIVQETIKLRRDENFESALQVIRTNRGKLIMDNIRVLVGEAKAEQNEKLRQLQQRDRQAKANARRTIFIFSTAIFLSSIIIVVAYYLIYREIIERKRTEEMLAQERDFIATILDTVGALVVILNPQGQIVRFNQTFGQIIQYSASEMQGKHFWHLFSIPEEVELVRTNFEQLLQGEHLAQHENYLVPKGGKRRLITWSNTALLNPKGSVDYVIYTGIDITERDWIEAEIRLLQVITQAITESENFPSALLVALSQVCEATGWNYGETWLPHSDGTTLTCGQTWCNNVYGQSKASGDALEQFRQMSQGYSFVPDQGLPGRVWSSKQPEWIQDVSILPEALFIRSQSAKESGLKAGLGVPILAGSEVLAILVFFMFDSQPEDKRLVELVSTVATQLGSVIQRKRAEEALRQSEARLQAILDNSTAVMYVKDIQGRFTLVNRCFETLFHIDRETVKGKTDYDIFPSEIADVFRSNDQQVLSAKAPLQWEEVAPHDDGLHTYLSSKFPLCDATGAPYAVCGISADITERKQMEQALQQANEKLTGWVSELELHNREISLLGQMNELLQACLSTEEAYGAISRLVQPLFPGSSGAVFTISASKRLVEAASTWGSALLSQKLFAPNECWALRRGRSHVVAAPQGSPCCQHLHSSDNPPSDNAESICVPMMARGEALGLLYLNSATGGQLTIGQQRLAVTVAEQIALALANLKLHETLQHQSIRDPLTGLFNRRYMEESLERELHRSQRKQQPVGIIMLDVDNFKRFNDTYGHEAGDEVLRELGLFLRKYTRGSDIACRYGGEELTLILPEACLETTRERAEQLREGIKHLHVQHRRQVLGVVTLSLGVAVVPDHGLSSEAVLQAADAALYRAKALGRDRVVIAESIPVAP
ncbi:diguanylate cyclase [Leptolyngbya sp. FACHB-261]|nr:diguanylate cyclase [Leptolyngbya sp. FACHB-261]